MHGVNDMNILNGFMVYKTNKLQSNEIDNWHNISDTIFENKDAFQKMITS